MGDAAELAMTVPGCGRREECLARDLQQYELSYSTFMADCVHTLFGLHQLADQSTIYPECPEATIAPLSCPVSLLAAIVGRRSSIW